MPKTERPISNSYWIIPDQFMAGEYPGQYSNEETRKKMDAFLEAGFNTFIDLTTPGERVPYEPLLREQARYYQKDVRYHRFTINDWGIPSPEKMRAIQNTIQESISNGGKIYIHCWAGIGRTGISVGCYLVEQGMSGEKALIEVNNLCHYASSPETAIQKEFVRKWVEQK